MDLIVNLYGSCDGFQRTGSSPHGSHETQEVGLGQILELDSVRLGHDVAGSKNADRWISLQPRGFCFADRGKISR